MSSDTLIDILPRRAPNLAALSRWVGLDRAAGGRIAGLDHIRQSILDILTTYPGERIMRPEYGCRLRDLIDRPVNAQWLADLYYEVAVAVQRWEPRVIIQRVAAQTPRPGHVVLDLALRLKAAPQPQTLRVEVSI
ncbi:GPW/gp25 family protein [Pseudothauera hydrothermalis]|uniref:GPW/gp25 family protein n=1 Tax=Pseudothauera hydrothermalis TaxID=2184083 RepID=UPI000E09CD4A|nr:GPW/gp25 family protein [Pseudothauera hydrothermalis]